MLALNPSVKIPVSEIGFNNTSGETRIYPNPTRDNLTIEFSDNSGVFRCSMFDANGRLILSESGEFKDQKQDVSLKQLSIGLYFVEVKTDKMTVRQKLFIH